MIKVGIIEQPVMQGGELVRILMGHKDAEIVPVRIRNVDRNMQMYIETCLIVDAKMHG